MSRETQRIDDYSWLEVLETDPRASMQEIEDLRSRVIGKWGLSQEEIKEELEKYSTYAEQFTESIQERESQEQKNRGI